MRLWSLHPKYLDARGLVALWREGLLAQKVLRGQTDGYRHHPQLTRFRDQTSHIGAIAEYLRGVHEESLARGYNFEARKIGRAAGDRRIPVTRGQVDYEWRHLLAKLARRDPARRRRLTAVKRPDLHPLFCLVSGSVETWERPK